MTRKITATMTATLLILMLLPIGFALADANSTGTIVSGVEVFPGNNQTMSIRINNTEATGTLGVIGVGKTIRFVSVVLPSSDGFRNAVEATPVTGWEVQRISSGSLQVIRFTNGSIAPGANFTFPFKVNVNRPLNGDVFATLDVAVSSDPQGATELRPTAPSAAGALTTTVRTLLAQQLVLVGPDEAKLPTNQPDMTHGGHIVVQTVLSNFAQNSQTVPVRLRSQTGAVPTNDVITRQEPPGTDDVTVPASPALGTPGQQTVRYRVDVDNPTSADRNHTYTFERTGAGSKLEPAQLVQRILVPARLTLNASQFAPTVIQTRQPGTKTFTIPVTKVGTPALTFSSVEMSFGGNTLACDTDGFNRGGTTNRTLTCSGNVTGASGRYDVTFTYTGSDDNGVAFNVSQSFDDLLRIDNALPAIIFEPITLPTGQSAARQGNTVMVSGRVDPGEDPDNGEPGSPVTLGQIVVKSTAGDQQTVPVSPTGNTFSANVMLNFPNAAGTDTHRFFVEGSVTNETGATGFGTTPLPHRVFDDVAPDLKNPGRVIEDTAKFGSKPVIELTFVEPHELRGGCNVDLWTVQNHTVQEVRYSNGDVCGAPGSTDPGDKTRILVTAGTIGVLEEPSVEYLPSILGQVNLHKPDRVHDGAINYAARKLINTVYEIAPGLPDILNNTATRNSGNEAAPFDEDTFWTRFDGTDFRIDASGVRTGWVVEVLAEDQATVIASREHQDSGQTAEQVAIPVGSVAPGGVQTFVRYVRFWNAFGPGPATGLSITVDKALPTLDSSTRSIAGDTSTISVTFTEKIWEGDQAPSDFYAWEHRTDSEGLDERWWYAVHKVTGGPSDTWTLEVQGMRGEPFGGVEYLMIRPNGARLGDRAGNTLADTMEFDDE